MMNISQETYSNFHKYIAAETGLHLRDDRAEILDFFHNSPCVNGSTC